MTKRATLMGKPVLKEGRDLRLVRRPARDDLRTPFLDAMGEALRLAAFRRCHPRELAPRSWNAMQEWERDGWRGDALAVAWVVMGFHFRGDWDACRRDLRIALSDERDASRSKVEEEEKERRQRWRSAS